MRNGNRDKRVTSGMLVSVIALAGALGACGGGASNTMPREELGDYFTMRLEGGSMQLKLEGNRLYGPNVEIVHDGDAFRGRAYGAVVDLRAEEGKVTGVIGSARTDLHVEGGEGVRVHFQGLVAGQLTDIDLSPAGLTGTVGKCGHDLKPTKDDPLSFNGRRACSGAFRFMTLVLPKALPALSPPERAVYLALLLVR